MTSKLSASIVNDFLRTGFIFLIATFLIISHSPIYSTEYNITTANLPPWSYDDGKSGIFADIVIEIEKRLGTNHQPKAVPWNRALMYVNSKNDYLMFPLTRTPEREKNYKWIVKIMPYTVSFVTFAGEKIDFEKARQLDAILVHQNSYPFHILEDKEFKNIEKTTHWFMYGSKQGVSSIIRRMEIGRVDAWFEATSVIKHITKGMENANKLVYGPTVVTDSWLYIVGSRSLSDELVNDYRNTFKEIKADGTFDRIMSKYIDTNQ